MQKLTRPQKEKLAILYDRWSRPLESYLSFRRTRCGMAFMDSVLMVQVTPTMVIGIETDGHAHS